MSEKKAELVFVDPEKYSIEKADASKIGEAFFPMITEREILHGEYLGVVGLEITPENCETAAVLYRKLVKVRGGIEKVRKSQKDFSLQYGRFVDAWGKAETLPVTQMEAKLKAMVDHYKIIEQERLAKLLADRMAMCEKIDVNARLMRLEEMTEDDFKYYYDGIVLADVARKERDGKIEAERIATEKKAEDERIAKESADRADRERIDKENEKLKAEAVKRDRATVKLRKEKEDAEARVKAIADAEAKVKADTEARESDRENMRRVNSEAYMSIMSLGISDADAKRIVIAIAKGEIENVSISY